MCRFTTGLGVVTSDLPQGNKISSVMRHNAEHGCRHCMISHSKLRDIEYDIIGNGRYHHITSNLLAQLRTDFQSKTAQSRFASEWGLCTSSVNPLDKLCFDRHLQVPLDPAHVLLQNISRILIESTFAVLNKSGEQKFTNCLSRMALPRGWSRFADPTTHLNSFFFSDYGRLIMVGAFVLLRLDKTHLSDTALLRLKISEARRQQILKEIIRCWTLMAQTNVICFASSMRQDDYNYMDSIIRQLATQLLKVCRR